MKKNSIAVSIIGVLLLVSSQVSGMEINDLLNPALRDIETDVLLSLGSLSPKRVGIKIAEEKEENSHTVLSLLSREDNAFPFDARYVQKNSDLHRKLYSIVRSVMGQGGDKKRRYTLFERSLKRLDPSILNSFYPVSSSYFLDGKAECSGESYAITPLTAAISFLPLKSKRFKVDVQAQNEYIFRVIKPLMESGANPRLRQAEDRMTIADLLAAISPKAKDLDVKHLREVILPPATEIPVKTPKSYLRPSLLLSLSLPSVETPELSENMEVFQERLEALQEDLKEKEAQKSSLEKVTVEYNSQYRPKQKRNNSKNKQRKQKKNGENRGELKQLKVNIPELEKEKGTLEEKLRAFEEDPEDIGVIDLVMPLEKEEIASKKENQDPVRRFPKQLVVQRKEPQAPQLEEEIPRLLAQMDMFRAMMDVIEANPGE